MSAALGHDWVASLDEWVSYVFYFLKILAFHSDVLRCAGSCLLACLLSDAFVTTRNP